jgi:glucan biosynthesis protein C
LVLAIPAAAILWCDQQIVIGYRSGMVPSLCKLLYYAMFFSVGTLVHRFRPASFPTLRTSVVYLALGSALFAGILPLVRQSQAGEQGVLGHLAFAALSGLYAWLMTLGLTGWFIRRTQRQTKVISYLADSSYWVYLLHLPFVTLAQIALLHVPVPAWAKLTAATLATLVMTLGSYQVLVRHTWLGAWLNGRRVPRADEVVSVKNLPTSSARRAA